MTHYPTGPALDRLHWHDTPFPGLTTDVELVEVADYSFGLPAAPAPHEPRQKGAIERRIEAERRYLGLPPRPDADAALAMLAAQPSPRTHGPQPPFLVAPAPAGPRPPRDRAELRLAVILAALTLLFLAAAVWDLAHARAAPVDMGRATRIDPGACVRALCKEA